MPTEYWLQKKAFNNWSHVTFYMDEAEAKRNFDKVSVEGNGYSWRMVSVEVIEERLLHGERPVMRPEPEEDEYKGAVNKIWSTPESKIKSDGWGKPTGTWTGYGSLNDITKSDHGMIGKVWLGNPVTKEKKRVDPEVANELLKTGNWVKAGPRTVL